MKFSVRFNNDLPVDRFIHMAALAEEAGFDQIWVSNDLFWQSAPVLVAAAARVTSRIALGVGVFNPVSMHPAEIAMAASSLQEVSDGRFCLGLGAGADQFLEWAGLTADPPVSRTERAINELRTLLQGDAPEGWRPEGRLRMVPLFVPISFDHRVARLETAIEPLQRLLRGELTTSRSEWLQLTDASIAVTSSSPPPIWIAAEGPRMLALAARCDGWNHAYWGAYDTGRFRVAAARLQEAIERAGRSREEVEASASIACVLDGWTEVPGGFREEEVAVGSAGDLARLVGDYADAGADHVILSLSPDPHAELDASALEKSREILEQL